MIRVLLAIGHYLHRQIGDVIPVQPTAQPTNNPPENTAIWIALLAAGAVAAQAILKDLVKIVHALTDWFPKWLEGNRLEQQSDLERKVVETIGVREIISQFGDMRRRIQELEERETVRAKEREEEQKRQGAEIIALNKRLDTMQEERTAQEIALKTTAQKLTETEKERDAALVRERLAVERAERAEKERDDLLGLRLQIELAQAEINRLRAQVDKYQSESQPTTALAVEPPAPQGAEKGTDVPQAPSLEAQDVGVHVDVNLTQVKATTGNQADPKEADQQDNQSSPTTQEK